MEFAARESCKRRRIETSGLPRSHLGLAISGGASGLPTVPSSGSFEIRVHPLFGFTLLRSCVREYLPVRLPWAPPLGFCSRIATSALRVHLLGRLPAADLRSAPDVSRVLDGFLLGSPGGLVSSHCHVPGFRSRGFLPRSSRQPFGDRYPLAVVDESLPWPFHGARARLVGLRVLLQIAIRSTRRGS